ncbi:MAG: hypothetical protein JSS37_02165 [Proteobacteria bacterium]|nr:hypothetical protein [Pseudomonadota bacterium]
MRSFKEFRSEEGIDYFILQVSQELIPGNVLINEGRWVSSRKKDWMLRVDAEDPALKQQRHVHVARAKHLNAKNMQVSWNDEEKKHDKKNFNNKIASIKAVQDIAKQAIKLPIDFKLEEAAKVENILTQLNESMVTGIKPFLFVVKKA